MRITDTGIVCPADGIETMKVRTFPAVSVLSDGSLLLTCRAGSTKDSEDAVIAVYRSFDNGFTWQEPTFPFKALRLRGARGSYRVCYVTEIATAHLLAGLMWVDRDSHPGRPLFNPETEGCLPMAILLSESDDLGKNWTPPREVPMPADIGPPSLTNPFFKSPGGSLVMSIETNKTYLDSSKWYQRVVLLHSSNLGKTWEEPVVAGRDPTGRIFNWDQRLGVSGDGSIAAFLWTYDSQAKTYLNVHRRVSRDEGRTWSTAEDLGFADQPSHPAVLEDGRAVLSWVDRFGSQSIRARFAGNLTEPFAAESEIVIYSHDSSGRKSAENASTGATLEDMGFWSYGLPYAEALPDGDVLVTYYAGDSESMDIHWARISLED